MRTIFGYIALGLLAMVVFWRFFATIKDHSDAQRTQPDVVAPDRTVNRPLAAPVRVIGKTLFREDFDDNRNEWVLEEKNDRGYTIQGGQYIMDNRTPDTYYWVNMPVPSLADSLDFSIEAEMQQLSGVKNNTYGLIWGLGNDHFYTIGLTGQRSYRISRYNGRTWEDLRAFKNQNAVQPYGKPNKILIQKRKYKLYFWINDHPVDTLAYQPMFGNRIGLGANGNIKFRTGYLQVTQN